MASTRGARMGKNEKFSQLVGFGKGRECERTGENVKFGLVCLFIGFYFVLFAPTATVHPNSTIAVNISTAPGFFFFFF